MELIFRKGTLADMEKYIHFLKEIKGEMLQKEWFYMDPPDMLQEMMADGTMELWLAMESDRMAAAFHILYPGLASWNYGYDLNLPREDLLLVIHMDSAAVHRDYRGLGLQRKLVQTAEAELSGPGRGILLCTVHPENRYSLNNMQKQGYEIQKCVEKYGSRRFVLRKDIF